MLLARPSPHIVRWLTDAILAIRAFGFVHLYQNTQNNEWVAIKFLQRGEEVTKYVEGEVGRPHACMRFLQERNDPLLSQVLNHRILRHPHVIEFKVGRNAHGEKGRMP